MVIFMCTEKIEEEPKKKNMNAVMAREKRAIWHANFANGA